MDWMDKLKLTDRKIDDGCIDIWIDICIDIWMDEEMVV
jgi:predicted amidohydrolase